MIHLLLAYPAILPGGATKVETFNTAGEQFYLSSEIIICKFVQ
jgi:hypothetical protein